MGHWPCHRVRWGCWPRVMLWHHKPLRLSTAARGQQPVGHGAGAQCTEQAQLQPPHGTGSHREPCAQASHATLDQHCRDKASASPARAGPSLSLGAQGSAAQMPVRCTAAPRALRGCTQPSAPCSTRTVSEPTVRYQPLPSSCLLQTPAVRCPQVHGDWMLILWPCSAPRRHWPGPLRLQGHAALVLPSPDTCCWPATTGLLLSQSEPLVHRPLRGSVRLLPCSVHLPLPASACSGVTPGCSSPSHRSALAPRQTPQAPGQPPLAQSLPRAALADPSA